MTDKAAPPTYCGSFRVVNGARLVCKQPPGHEGPCTNTIVFNDRVFTEVK